MPSPPTVAEPVRRPTTPAATVWPTVGSAAVRALLTAPAQGRVVGAFPSAVYVELDGRDVVAVVTSDGLHLPNALVVAVASAAAPFAGHRAGDAALVRDGVLNVGPVGYRPVRWRPVRPPAPGGALSVAVVDELAAGLRSPHTGALADVLAAATAGLRTSLTQQDVVGALRAADALLGRGPGLTPSGDDVLAGALVTCLRLGASSGTGHLAPTAAQLGRHVRRVARGRTCALSAALLRHAVDGLAAPPVLDVVDALLGVRPLAPALADLLAVGHTSGADTAAGVLAAARALLHRPQGR